MITRKFQQFKRGDIVLNSLSQRRTVMFQENEKVWVEGETVHYHANLLRMAPVEKMPSEKDAKRALIERFIQAELANDETSTDAEIIAHIDAETGIGRNLAAFIVQYERPKMMTGGLPHLIDFSNYF